MNLSVLTMPETFFLLDLTMNLENATGGATQITMEQTSAQAQQAQP